MKGEEEEEEGDADLSHEKFYNLNNNSLSTLRSCLPQRRLVTTGTKYP